MSELDGADRFSVATHMRGDVAAPLIYTATVLDYLSIDREKYRRRRGPRQFDGLVQRACARRRGVGRGRLSHLRTRWGSTARRMGRAGRYCCRSSTRIGARFQGLRETLLALVADIASRPGHALALSIDLAGMLVLAGNEEGLTALLAETPPTPGRDPLRLAGHGPFHTPLMFGSSDKAMAELPHSLFHRPALPLIDGRGHIWRRHASDPAAIWDYTFGHQILAPYDFARSVQVAVREYAPDVIILPGPGDTLGGAIAQSLIGIGLAGNFEQGRLRRAAGGRPDRCCRWAAPNSARCVTGQNRAGRGGVPLPALSVARIRWGWSHADERQRPWGPTQGRCTVHVPYRRGSAFMAGVPAIMLPKRTGLAGAARAQLGDELQPQQLGDIAGAGAAHDVGAVHLDRARAEFQLPRDRLVAEPRGDGVQYVALARGQCRQPRLGLAVPVERALPCAPFGQRLRRSCGGRGAGRAARAADPARRRAGSRAIRRCSAVRRRRRSTIPARAADMVEQRRAVGRSGLTPMKEQDAAIESAPSASIHASALAKLRTMRSAPPRAYGNRPPARSGRAGRDGYGPRFRSPQHAAREARSRTARKYRGRRHFGGLAGTFARAFRARPERVRAWRAARRRPRSTPPVTNRAASEARNDDGAATSAGCADIGGSITSAPDSMLGLDHEHRRVDRAGQDRIGADAASRGLRSRYVRVRLHSAAFAAA